MTLSLPGVGVFDRETILGELRRVRGNKAGELLADSIDHEQIAVGTVILAKPDVATRGLCVRGVHLENRR